VGHGRPDPLDVNEPLNLARTIAALRLKYVVITSVDRDDLRDGGSGHFVECIKNIRELSPETQIEILVPDFRGRDDRALEILKSAPPDVMNHNLETAPRLYKEARPGSDYQFSLNLLKKFKELHPDVPTKSGIMVGLGETDEEILQVMRDMRAHNIDMLTIGQYWRPPTATCPCAAMCTPTPSRCSSRRPTRWASPTPPWAPWCAPATTPTSRPMPPASEHRRKHSQAAPGLLFSWPATEQCCTLQDLPKIKLLNKELAALFW
jgi:lipoate synthase